MLSIVELLAVVDTGKANCLQSVKCDTGLPVIAANNVSLQNILQLVFGILAVVAVLIITIAGLRFIAESTNPQETARARNTIIYAVVGLVIALSGELIVSFVLGRTA